MGDISSSGQSLFRAWNVFENDADALFGRVILVVIAGLLNVGRLVYTIVFAYAFLSNAFFLVCLPCC
jgi:hypothetical protein